MKTPWTCWYPEAMGPQEKLWCAVRLDDMPQVRECLAQGASANWPGPQGNAREMAQAHNSHRVLAGMGWNWNESAEMPDLSLADLDAAIGQIDSMRGSLGIEQPGDDFLDLLPFLGGARLVPEDPTRWKAIEGVSRNDARLLFRATHQNEAVLVMTAADAAPVLLLSAAGAMKWAPRLLDPSHAAASATSSLN